MLAPFADDLLRSREVTRTRLASRLRKYFDGCGFWEGHDFNPCRTSFKKRSRFSPRGTLFAISVFPPSARPLAQVAQGRFGEQQVLGTNHSLVFGEDQSAFDHRSAARGYFRSRAGLQQLQRGRRQFRRRCRCKQILPGSARRVVRYLRNGRATADLDGKSAQAIIQDLRETFLREPATTDARSWRKSTRASTRTSSALPRRWISFCSRKRSSLGCRLKAFRQFRREKCSPLRRLNSSRIRLHGSRESAAGVTKKFGFQHGLGNGGTVDHSQRATPTRAQIMHGSRDNFLTAARWPRDQNRCVARSQQAASDDTPAA